MTINETHPNPPGSSRASAVDRVVDERPFVSGGRPWRWSPRGAVALAIVLVVAMVPVPGLYQATGGTMEEGFMLYFPELLRRGEIPNVDFLHLYGPGALHVLAGWYELFGNSLVSERTFGLLQNLGIIFGIYAIARIWGRGVAAGAGVVATLIIMTPIGLQAMAWHGAVALGLWAVVFALRARAVDGRSATRCWLAAGLLAGLGLAFRPDLILAVLFATGFLAWRDRRAIWKPLVGGALIGLIPMWVHLVMAGPRASFDGMVIDPVFELRPGRELPSPPSWSVIDGSLLRVVEFYPPWWDLPAIDASKQLFFWFWGMVAAAILIPAWAWMRRLFGDQRDEMVVLLAGGLFALGVLGQGLQRPDSTHLAWVTVASWPLLVPVAAELLRRTPGILRRVRGAAPRSARGPLLPRAGVAPAAFVAVGLLMLVVCPFYTYRHYVLHTRVSVGALREPFIVERNGREFYFGAFDAAETLQHAVDDLDRWSKPGERLIVGPYDLSRTYYNEAVVYWMFPELDPGTYYIEMDPGVADADDSGLADEVAEADWILLTKFWKDWHEPNISSEHRSQEPNDVIADRFCLVGNYPTPRPPEDPGYQAAYVTLYHRCGAGNGIGISPADVDDTTPVTAMATP